MSEVIANLAVQLNCVSHEMHLITEEKVVMRQRHKEEIEELEKRFTQKRREQRLLQNQIEGEKNRIFKEQLFKDNGFEIDDPVAEKVYAKAWERGHSNGHNEVKLEFEDLIELVR